MRLPRRATQGDSPGQLAAIKRQKVNESDVDEGKQPDREQSRAQAGHAGGHEEIHGVGLDVAAEIGKALLFSGFVLLIGTACADVEGLHRVDIMPQSGTACNKRKT